MPSAVLPASAAPTVQLRGLGVRFLIEGAATGGRFSLVEHPLEPRSLGSPVHTHRDEDEYSYVLEGEVGLQIGDETLTARAGDLVLKPRGVPHAFWNATDEPARLLEIVSPAGFEDYFREVEAAGEDLGRLSAAAQAYGLDMDVASIPALMERNGLVR